MKTKTSSSPTKVSVAAPAYSNQYRVSDVNPKLCVRPGVRPQVPATPSSGKKASLVNWKVRSAIFGSVSVCTIVLL